jgi:hypothetical protein
MGGSDMQHPLEFEIRDRLSAFLADEISLHDFEDWFFPKTWDVDKLDEPDLLDLVYQIKLDWAEFTDGHWSLEQLRSMLHSLVERYTVSFSSTEPKLVSGTTSKILQFPLVLKQSGLSAGIKSSAVSV